METASVDNMNRRNYVNRASHIPAMTRVFTLNMFQHIVTTIAATSFLRGQDFHASRA